MNQTTLKILGNKQTVCGSVIKSMIDEWNKDSQTCQMVPIRMMDVEHQKFFVDSEYFMGLGYDYPQTKWEIMSQRSIDWNEMVNIVQARYNEWFQKHQLIITQTIEIYNIPMDIAILICKFTMKQPGVFQFDVNNKYTFAIGVKTFTIGCIICANKRNNKLWEITKITESDRQKHLNSIDHINNCE